MTRIKRRLRLDKDASDFISECDELLERFATDLRTICNASLKQELQSKLKAYEMQLYSYTALNHRVELLLKRSSRSFQNPKHRERMRLPSP
jgi:hypothetical protein